MWMGHEEPPGGCEPAVCAEGIAGNERTPAQVVNTENRSVFTQLWSVVSIGVWELPLWLNIIIGNSEKGAVGQPESILGNKKSPKWPILKQNSVEVMRDKWTQI